MPDTKILDKGHFTISGEVDGIPTTVEGNAKNIRLAYNETYHLIFDNDDNGKMYTIKKEAVVVSRVARVEASDSTAAAFEVARVRCGAPERAKITVLNYPRGGGGIVLNAKNTPTPVAVEFQWTDEVYV